MTPRSSGSLRGLRAALVIGFVVVVGAGVAVELLRFGSSLGTIPIVSDGFSLSLEANVPTWYSSMLLFGCAIALWVTAPLEAARWRWHWRGLAIVFGGISMDEVAAFHERINPTTHIGGVLYFAWVIPFGAFVLVVAVLWLPLLAALPPFSRWRFVLSAALYVGGALGVELVLGAWTSQHGPMNLTYRMIDAVEESGEIGGASLFLWTVLAHRARRLGERTPTSAA